MRLYHVPNTRSFRVLWMLEEVGEPYELTVLERDGRQTAEHLARHPLGQVPVADDGEGMVFESTALCLQLADLHPGKGLAPMPGTHERALLYQWLFFAMTELEVPLVEVYVEQRVRDEPIEQVLVAGQKRFAKAIAVIERELAGRSSILERGFSVADVVLGEMMSFAAFMELTGDSPNVNAYCEQLAQRPAHQRATAVGKAPAAS